MIVYRLCKAAHTALDGEGALYGGRWNPPGNPMVYTAASPSLAVLEVMVHLDLPADLLPDDYRLLTVHIPDDATVLRLDLNTIRSIDCRTAGDAFLTQGNALVLLVRSAVVPQESNALLNVKHADMQRVSVVSDEPFAFDPRLFVSGP